MTRPRALVTRLSLLLVVLAGVSLLLGRSGWLWPWEHVGRDADLARLILWELRAPRLLLAILVGAALGLAGAVLQGLTRNPLAEPGLLGVSSVRRLAPSLPSTRGWGRPGP